MKKRIQYKDDNVPASNTELIPKEIYEEILNNVPIVCVDLVIVKENKVFLIKRENKPCLGAYWIQGGRLGKNETPENCGIRRVSKELNVDISQIKITQYLGTFSTEFNDSEQGSASHTVNMTFQAELLDVEPTFDNDHSDGKWFRINGEIPEDIIDNYQHHPYIKDIIALINPLKVLITGASGFIGSHLGKRLMSEGYQVIGADWVRPEFMETKEFCHEFHLLDLRKLSNCKKVCENVHWVFNLAADMGGMGFIQSNHSRIGYNNTQISLNVLEAARNAKVARYFYASSACVYPTEVQDNSSNTIMLKEDLAWPSNPQDIYGLEKLYAEEVAMHYSKEFPELKVRVGRFHGIYGEKGTWKGGREKVPAAFCRKAAASTEHFEMWGDGQQTRSFCYIDDCLEAIIRIIRSDYTKPLNIGSEELISMNDFADLVMDIANNKLPIKHIEGPEGVRGRNSDNTLIKEVLGWAPSIPLKVGIKNTYDWIKAEVEAERENGIDVEQYHQSNVVTTEAPEIDYAD
jgi:nucleoside-diphosphate-sugar epimerase/ADP-ribose pyrophosphatase YjhB (NUDIX family)